MAEDHEEKRDRFHQHLDECARCRERPFDLCGVGAVLLEIAGRAAGASAEPPQA